MAKTGPQVAAHLNRAVADAKRRLIAKYQDEYDGMVNETMARAGFIPKQRVITSWDDK